jgi:hypothetical protein
MGSCPETIVLQSAVAHDFGGPKPNASASAIPDLAAEASPEKKNISVFPKCKSLYQSARLTRQEGRLAIVTNVR